ncbi:DUF397 domain-containing protein [Streptomyces sp. NPDC051162]|uniref:DUF397 domain-containing protein n=1 Tax=unclassified Streptomyces TaxID=2593676 RepID=UPI00344303CD
MKSEPTWCKSSYSDTEGECVEVAARPHVVHVRDSKRIPGPQLTFPASSWAEFTAYAVADA